MNESRTDPENTLVLATRNQGKIRELKEPLHTFGFEVVGLDAFPDVPEIEETGSTFEENALIKARTVAQLTGHVAIADDSGLEVDALDGAPGVSSARYSEDSPELQKLAPTKDERNMLKLLAALSSVPIGRRGGKFRTVIAVCTPEGKSMTAAGEWEGRIVYAPRGSNGFGYDPVFFDPELGRTAAELSREEKMALSHRSKALQKLLQMWPDFWENRNRS